MTTVDLQMPYWGDPTLLDRAVASVLAQDDPHWTLTIVDDHYPDLHAQRTYQNHPDSRVQYQRHTENIGLAANFEYCRGTATGDLVVFLGCDDLLAPEYVGRIRALAEAVPSATIIQPGVQVIDEHGHASQTLTERVKARLAPKGDYPLVLDGEALAISLLRGNWLYWPSLAFRREALAEHRFRLDLPVILDLALIIDLVLDGARLLVDDQVCFSYRRHSQSASSTSLLGGDRFADERRFFNDTAATLRSHHWRRAARVSRQHLISRLHALTLLPKAVSISVQERSAAPVRTVARHVLSG